ncbi:MAG TPA: class I SAM-dependent methyltransferase [Thermoplasmata archaeon]|nr:class I SAM-dependent methyltransferase [Thermoplasmata archaeon]
MPAQTRSAYRRFAAYYDFIYHDLVNYDGDVDFLEAVFRRTMRSPPRALLDLGCGTGNHDLPLARRGYEVTGLDLSQAQLAIARRKARNARLPVRFVHGDMRTFRLGRTFDAAVCMFVAIGYLTRSMDFVRCLRSLRRHLNPGAVFVFEFWHTPAARPRDDWFHKAGPEYELIRLGEGRYDVHRHLVSVAYHFFVFRSRKILDRFDEDHVLRTYTIPEMRALLRRCGFDLVGAYAATNVQKGFRRPARDTFRIMAVARARAPKQS